MMIKQGSDCSEWSQFLFYKVSLALKQWFSTYVLQTLHGVVGNEIIARSHRIFMFTKHEL